MATVRFCECCSLRRGTVIWGALCLVVDAARFIASVVIFATTDYGLATTLLFLISLFATVIDIITSVLLIIGAHQKRKRFILPWLVYYFAEMVFAIPVVMFACPAVALFLLVQVLYAWFCILYFYKSLGNEPDGGSNNATNSKDTVPSTL